MFRRIAWWVVGVPAAVLLLTLAVINRHGVRLTLDPFRPDEPLLSLVLPFYIYLFGMLLVGIVIGGAATWMTQARWRRAARRHGADAQRWQTEADRLSRDRQAAATRQLAPINR
jgi:uncharacterized integral membrane protein